ncbi:hypothetical protein ScPMuIL_001081, partial [Solemya velum]
MAKRRRKDHEGRWHRPETDNEEDLERSQAPDFETHRKEAETGIVESVSLKNFMCHSRLDVTLGPHVNFIVGRNGSGKSAIVTALVVGLGGKASITNRGNTIKGFIKTGKQSGEVQIKLRNQGTDAFKHNEYGDQIVIERRFTGDGGSQYKLKGKDGHVVSQKREELAHILDRFNIQVDNPVSILNQDTSRNFLNSKSPHDKYKFFLKATQLEQMKVDYGNANEQRKIAKDIIHQKEQTLPHLEEEVLEWEQKFKALDALDELKTKVQQLKEEMAWSFVIEKERGLAPIQKGYQQEENRLPKFRQKVEEASAKVESLIHRHQEIQDQIKVISEEVTKLQPQFEKTKQERDGCKKPERTATMELRKIEVHHQNLKKEKDLIKDRIVELRTSAQHDYEAERQTRENKVKKLEEQCERLRAQQQTTDHHLEQVRSAIMKYKIDDRKLTDEHRNMNEKANKLTRNLSNLQAARSDRLKRFGPYVPQLLQFIDDANRLGRFRKRPIGPIGSCFQLREPQWALAIESCLGGLIQSFCCHCHEDARVLDQIFNRTCRDRSRPSIIVCEFKDKLHDISSRRVQSGKYISVVDILEIENPVIARCLIDQRNIENIILIPDGREARSVMDPEKQPGPPANCREAFTLAGDHIYCHPSLRYYSNNQDKARFLTANVEEDILNLENEIKKLAHELEALQQERSQVSKEIDSNRKEERKAGTQLMKIGESISKITYEISELKSVEDPAPVDVATLEEEVENYEEQIRNTEQQKEIKQEQLTQLKNELAAAQEAFKQVESEMRAKHDASIPLKDEFGHAKVDIDNAKLHRKHYEEELKSDEAKAKQICGERKNTRRTPQNLESEINHIIKRIKTEEKSRGNPEEVTKMYYETKESYIKIKKEVSQLKHFIAQLENVMLHRQHQYSEFRKLIAMRAKYFFIVLLNNREYTGKMTFNHPKETLEMA